MKGIDNPQSWEEALDIVLGEMYDLMVDRHRKYGPTNILDGGMAGLLVRVKDKIARIGHALNPMSLEDLGFPRVFKLLGMTADYDDELFDDAWLDLSNYTGPIYLMVKRGWWELPMEEDMSHDDCIFCQDDPDDYVALSEDWDQQADDTITVESDEMYRDTTHVRHYEVEVVKPVMGEVRHEDTHEVNFRVCGEGTCRCTE